MPFSVCIILLFNMDCAEALSGVSKCKKVGMCHTEKIHVLDQLCSGRSYRAFGCELSVIYRQGSEHATPKSGTLAILS